MHTDFLSYGSSRISYTRYGNGSQLLLCFHGYGESAASFAFLESALGADLTLLAIDMPYHGQTEWKEGLFFDPAVLLSLIREIAAGLPGLKKGWWLLGYSMGGRVALQLLESDPAAIEKLVLLAPDGLKVHLWYGLATRTRLGNHLFRWTMRWPGWFFLLLRLSNTLGLVNPSVYKFAVHYINDDKARRDVYIRWTTMRGFRPRLSVIADIIRSRRLPVSLVYGRYDRIIRWERAEKFRKRGIAATCQLILLDTGHQLLRPQYLDVLLSLFPA
jgi:pimeloyl-ACP methyl ester carboxylesterase